MTAEDSHNRLAGNLAMIQRLLLEAREDVCRLGRLDLDGFIVESLGATGRLRQELIAAWLVANEFEDLESHRITAPYITQMHVGICGRPAGGSQ